MLVWCYAECAHWVNVEVCGAARLLGTMEGTISVKMSVAIVESVVIVTGVLQ